MDAHKFTATYRESRNGANCFYRHWYVSRFHYSDGVHDIAELGCHWLLDIAATEIPVAMRKHGRLLSTLTANVNADNKVTLALAGGEESDPIWSRQIDYTDMPEGDWEFFIADERERFAMILPTEY